MTKSPFTEPVPRSEGSAVQVDGETLRLDCVRAVAFGHRAADAAEGVQDAIVRSRKVVDDIVASDQVVYSVNTGFGILSDVHIANEDVDRLQLNLVRSHAAGTGDPLPTEVVRAMMLLRANTLAKGVSGVRPEVFERLLDMVRTGVHPVVPSQGSLGASGDLAPLAHLTLVLIGEGMAELGGEILPGGEAMRRAGLEPLTLRAKEGLALLNGTQMMTAIAALAVEESRTLAKIADVACAMSIEGVLGSHKPFRAEVHEVRPHPGQIASASNARRLLDGSAIAASHAQCSKVQDAYSFRCAPQVHGAVRDTLSFVGDTVEREVNAATDNPLVFPETGDAISQGNFHGEPIALAADYLAIAMAELGNISERRTDKLNDPRFSDLPAFLTSGENAGLESGTMIVHYTAASLVSENKVLAHPASVDSIPTSANKEDHVSMGSIAARKAARVIRHTRHILATELFCASQALRLRHPLDPGRGAAAAQRFLAERIRPIEGDRVFADDIEQVATWVGSGELLQAVEAEVGPLV